MSDPTERNTPAKTPEEWRYIWQGARKGHQLDKALGPVARIVADWRWWAGAFAIGGSVALLMRRPEFWTLIGGGA